MLDTVVSSPNAYLPPFDLVRRSLDIQAVRGELVASLPYEDFVKLVKKLIGGMYVDEPWYLARYPDVADGIARGIVRSAREHFIQDGYFEGRLPFELHVDEGWYLSRHPDVAEAVERGEFDSGRDHFNKLGYLEGREPFPL